MDERSSPSPPQSPHNQPKKAPIDSHSPHFPFPLTFLWCKSVIIKTLRDSLLLTSFYKRFSLSFSHRSTFLIHPTITYHFVSVPYASYIHIDLLLAGCSVIIFHLYSKTCWAYYHRGRTMVATKSRKSWGRKKEPKTGGAKSIKETRHGKRMKVTIKRRGLDVEAFIALEYNTNAYYLDCVCLFIQLKIVFRLCKCVFLWHNDFFDGSKANERRTTWIVPKESNSAKQTHAVLESKSHK